MTAQAPDPLLVAIQRLTSFHMEAARVPGETRAHYVRHEPLLLQLRNAVGGNVMGGGAGGAPASQRTPIDPDALDKYLGLVTRIQDFFFAWTGERAPVDERPELTLTSAYLAYQRAVSLDAVDAVMLKAVPRIWEAQVVMIGEKLSPPTKRDLPGAVCPECGMDWFIVVTNRGKPSLPKGLPWYEKEQRIALSVTYRPDGQGGLSQSYVRCGCCETVWPGDGGLRFIAHEIEAPSLVDEVEAVLAASEELVKCGIDPEVAMDAAEGARGMFTLTAPTVPADGQADQS